MSNIAGISGGLGFLKNPTNIRYTISTINTEEGVALPAGTKAFTVQNVGGRFVKMAYTSGDIASNKYLTLSPYLPVTSPGIINQGSLTLYFESTGLETLEIDIWR